jgi:hypothetical protein
LRGRWLRRFIWGPVVLPGIAAMFASQLAAWWFFIYAILKTLIPFR